MSENYRMYAQKRAELRASWGANGPLRMQVLALLEVVRDCEARWALEERIGRG